MKGIGSFGPNSGVYSFRGIMMRRLLSLLIVATLFLVPSFSIANAAAKRAPAARVNVKGYTKNSGATVAPHQRTAPNGTQHDNWSAKGNVNPNTGKVGTKAPKK
jgi:hypothetical protein